MKLWLEYFDQNETFAKVLPKSGIVDRSLESLDGGKWVLFRLDTTVEYERLSYEHFLLRSRWSDSEIGGEKPTSVFILLVDDLEKARDGFDVRAFYHVAWGMVRRL